MWERGLVSNLSKYLVVNQNKSEDIITKGKGIICPFIFYLSFVPFTKINTPLSHAPSRLINPRSCDINAQAPLSQALCVDCSTLLKPECGFLSLLFSLLLPWFVISGLTTGRKRCTSTGADLISYLDFTLTVSVRHRDCIRPNEPKMSCRSLGKTHARVHVWSCRRYCFVSG